MNVILPLGRIAHTGVKESEGVGCLFGRAGFDVLGYFKGLPTEQMHTRLVLNIRHLFQTVSGE